MGHGGSLVDSAPFGQRVLGSNLALSATYGPWESPSLAVVHGPLAWNSDRVFELYLSGLEEAL